MLTFILLFISFMCLLLAALNVTLSPRINLLALGLALYVFVALLPAFSTLAH